MERTTHEPVRPVCPPARAMGCPYTARMPYRRAVLLLAAASAVAGCGRGSPPASAPREGMLAGIIRTSDTGQPVSDAVVVLRRPGQLQPVEERTSGTGAYMIPRLPPGSYQVKVYRDQRTLGDEQVRIEAGKVTGLDLAVSPRAGDEHAVAVDVAAGAPLWVFRPPDADPLRGVIEGTVAEHGGRTRLGGAVVTVADGSGALVDQAVSDDDGRFRLDGLAPGAYVVSAYYTLLGRGQFEIRRTDVRVGAGEVVVVPLAIETDAR